MTQDDRTLARRVATTLLIVTLPIVSLAGPTPGGQGRDDQDRQRERWQRVGDIFRAMDVRPGAAVADIGAGDGFFTTRLSEAVGPSGRVFAVDIDESQLDRLRRRLGQESHRNVSVTKGTSTDPRLPDGTLDSALIVNAYHEMAEHQAMLAAIRRALKPTGRLVIVEPIAEARRATARPGQVREHEIAPEFVMQDARAAGFRIVGLEDPFTTRGRVVEWMLTVTPSAGAVPTTMLPAESTASVTDEWRDPGLRISADDVERLVRSGAGTLIDVRDEVMFAKGHIPDAMLIPLQDIEASAERVRGSRRPFVTYCS